MDASIDSIQAFFAEHAPVNAVRLRRHITSRDFKGSVFVELASVEQSDRVVGMALTFQGAPLRLQKKVTVTKEVWECSQHSG